MTTQIQTPENRPGATIHRPEQLSAVLTATAASLPVTVRDAERTVRALDGRSPWSQELADALGTDADGQTSARPRALLVLAPSVQDPDALRALQAVSQRESAPVVLDHPYAGDPAVDAASLALADLAELTSASVRTVEAGRRPRDVLAEQVLLLGRLGVEDIALEVVHETGQGAVAHGWGLRGGTLARIALVATSSEVRGSCQVRLEGPDAAFDLDLAPADDARPARAVLVTDRGALSLPAIHESAHRHALRRALTVDATTELDEFATACAVLVRPHH